MKMLSTSASFWWRHCVTAAAVRTGSHRNLRPGFRTARAYCLAGLVWKTSFFF